MVQVDGERLTVNDCYVVADPGVMSYVYEDWNELGETAAMLKTALKQG